MPWPHPPRSPNYYFKGIGSAPVWTRNSTPDRTPGGDRPGSPAYPLQAGAAPDVRTARIQSAAQLCPDCRFFAWHTGQDPIAVAGRWHHPGCVRVARARISNAGAIDTTGKEIASYPARSMAQVTRPDDHTFAPQIRTAAYAGAGCACEAGAAPLLKLLGGNYNYNPGTNLLQFAPAATYTKAAPTSYATQAVDTTSTTYGQAIQQGVNQATTGGGTSGGGTSSPASSSFPWGWTLGGIGVLALVGLAVWGTSSSRRSGRARRRRRRRRNPRKRSRSKRRRANPIHLYEGSGELRHARPPSARIEQDDQVWVKWGNRWEYYERGADGLETFLGYVKQDYTKRQLDRLVELERKRRSLRKGNPRRPRAEAQHARAEGKRLRAQLKRERLGARAELRAVRAQCKAGREELAEQRRELADACAFQREASKLGARERVSKASRDLETFRSIEDARRILRGGSHPRKMRRTSAEALSESDDAVAVNLPDDLIPIWRRVKGKVRGSAHQSRTEAFFHWVEEHPDEIARMQSDAAEQDVERMIREYEQSYAANPAHKFTRRQHAARAKKLRKLLRGAKLQQERRARITTASGESVVLK